MTQLKILSASITAGASTCADADNGGASVLNGSDFEFPFSDLSPPNSFVGKQKELRTDKLDRSCWWEIVGLIRGATTLGSDSCLSTPVEPKGKSSRDIVLGMWCQRSSEAGQA